MFLVQESRNNGKTGGLEVGADTGPGNFDTENMERL